MCRSDGVASTDSIAVSSNSALTARTVGSDSARIAVQLDADALVCSGTATAPRWMHARSTAV
ncbi:Uncharacterised protein [Mycobacteroides abscessus subsp. abscessus]|nr:Uncharacterised protein [Mycobacteroides abscessus subsp. abscessus]